MTDSDAVTTKQKESIATADAQVLPQLLARLPVGSRTVLELIRTSAADSRPPEPTWVNLSVAELTVDASASGDALLAYLPSARPAEIRVVTPLLAGVFQSMFSSNSSKKSWVAFAPLPSWASSSR